MAELFNSIDNPSTVQRAVDKPLLVSREDRLRLFFLSRLDYLIRLRDDPAGLSPEGERLVKWALYSIFRDCQSWGAGDEARARLSRK